MVQTIPVRKLSLFAILSSLDLLLTWLLLQYGDGAVYESNPVANWWLAHGGWLGLAGFKFGVVALVGCLCAVISLYQPRAGRLILSFACSILLVVVLYSSAVAGYVGVQTELQEARVIPSPEESAWKLERQLRGDKEYRALREHLSKELIGGRDTLREAVAKLAASEMGHDARWLKILHLNYPDLPDEVCLAANFMEFTLDFLENHPSTAAAPRLEAEFQALYRIRPPRLWGVSLVWKGEKKQELELSDH